MSSAPTKTRLLRACMYVKRKQDMSEDDFNKHWTEKHAPLVSEWLARHGVVRYTQYHTSPSLTSSSEGAWPELAAMTRIPYDGVVEFLVPDIACLRRAREDAFYKEKVVDDENSFFETAPSQIAWTVGWEEVYIAGGNVLGEPTRGVISG